jgi:hypothetical protein
VKSKWKDYELEEDGEEDTAE